MKKKTIAIDGASSSGKSSVAKFLAKKINFRALDSGSLYRSLTYYGLKNIGKDLNLKMELLLRYLHEHPHTLQIEWQGNQSIALLMGKPAPEEIRSEEVTQLVHAVAENAFCRSFINKLLIRAAFRHDIVVEGRDIGTEVFPDAWKKFFLTAAPVIRAQRKAKEMGIPFPSEPFNRLFQTIENRDAKDKNRTLAPLRKAEDAMEIDVSFLEIPEVVDLMMKHLD